MCDLVGDQVRRGLPQVGVRVGAPRLGDPRATEAATRAGFCSFSRARQFPPDFFDLVVIDERHRGSAANDSAWREVLD